MRIVFMGTPDFAVPSLKALVDAGHEIAAVYSQPDKPKGRGHKLQPTPVKEFALIAHLPISQPPTLKDPAVLADLQALAPDCIVVVAYGRILSKAVLEIPKYGCINVHGSLLPKYRGAAPIQWAVLNGEAVTGITTMLLGDGPVDTGDMLLKAETAIGPDETSGQLFDRLKEIGAALLIKTLDTLPEITPEPQNNCAATLAPMLQKEMSEIDWTHPAEVVHNQIRGLNPWPCTSAVVDGKRLKIYTSKVLEIDGTPGEAFVQDGALCIFCGKGAVALLEIQPENSKRMTSGSYLLGHPLKGC